MLMSETMWMSMAPAITRNHMKVFPLTTKGKEATFAVALMTAMSQLRKRDIEGFIDNAYPLPHAQNKSA